MSTCEKLPGIRILSKTAALMALVPLLFLSGCENAVVLNPSGDVAAQQRDLLVVSTVLMLLIIIPVIALTIFFAWRYRESNKAARYEPDWDHSTQLELIIWAAPLLIIICLGAITWLGTHLLDPYRQIDRIAAGKEVPQTAQPLRVNVVALDWKWLFIYPEQGIATVNELVVPVDRPLSLRITSSTVMNSLYIPELAGQIYAMPGMETQLHGVINRVGDSQGFSANYSGAGFSGMKLAFRGMDDAGFDAWISAVKASDRALTSEAYLELEQPSEREPIQHYAQVQANLYDAILNACVTPGKMCRHDMMAIDARGGLGLASNYNVAPLPVGAPRAPLGSAGAFVAGICTIDDESRAAEPQFPFANIDRSPLAGAGLPDPRLSVPSLLAGNDLNAR